MPLLPDLEQAGPPTEMDEGEAMPVLLVVVDDEGDLGPGADAAHASEVVDGDPLRLLVERGDDDRLPTELDQGVADGDGGRIAGRVGGGEAADAAVAQKGEFVRGRRPTGAAG